MWGLICSYSKGRLFLSTTAQHVSYSSLPSSLFPLQHFLLMSRGRADLLRKVEDMAGRGLYSFLTGSGADAPLSSSAGALTEEERRESERKLGEFLGLDRKSGEWLTVTSPLSTLFPVPPPPPLSSLLIPPPSSFFSHHATLLSSHLSAYITSPLLSPQVKRK